LKNIVDLSKRVSFTEIGVCGRSYRSWRQRSGCGRWSRNWAENSALRNVCLGL